MENKDQVDIIALLDSSGSMQNMGSEPEEAINDFIQEQKKANEKGTFSLWTFDTKVTKVIDDESLQTIQPYKNFRPGGMTSLYDAIGNAITLKLTKENYQNVVCLIITDGNENSSQDFTSKDIKKLITEMENKNNWKFIFLGANQDVIVSGGNIGIKPNLCGAYQQIPGELLKVTRSISESVSNLRNNYTPLNISLKSSSAPEKENYSPPSTRPISRQFAFNSAICPPVVQRS
jgi:uncharacterized protein YegL